MGNSENNMFINVKTRVLGMKGKRNKYSNCIALQEQNELVNCRKYSVF